VIGVIVMETRDTIEAQRDEVARAKRRMLIAARGDRPRIEGVVGGVPCRPLPSLAKLAAANPGTTASLALAVVCLLGVGGTIALAGRAVKMAGLVVTARRLLKN
jgi:hypothetical protein